MQIINITSNDTIEILLSSGRTVKVYNTGYIRTVTRERNIYTGEHQWYQLNRTVFNPKNKAKGLFNTADQLAYVMKLETGEVKLKALDVYQPSQVA